MHRLPTCPGPNAQAPEPPASNGAAQKGQPFTELDMAALRESAPAAPPRAAPSKPSSRGGGKKGSSRPLTELDMMALRAADGHVPRIEWPQKRSFIGVALCAGAGRLAGG